MECSSILLAKAIPQPATTLELFPLSNVAASIDNGGYHLQQTSNNVGYLGLQNQASSSTTKLASYNCGSNDSGIAESHISELHSTPVDSPAIDRRRSERPAGPTPRPRTMLIVEPVPALSPLLNVNTRRNRSEAREKELRNSVLVLAPHCLPQPSTSHKKEFSLDGIPHRLRNQERRLSGSAVDNLLYWQQDACASVLQQRNAERVPVQPMFPAHLSASIDERTTVEETSQPPPEWVRAPMTRRPQTFTAQHRMSPFNEQLKLDFGNREPLSDQKDSAISSDNSCHSNQSPPGPAKVSSHHESLDSACGSSPVLVRSADLAPLRTSSPLIEFWQNQPKSDISGSRHSLICRKSPSYRECRDVIDKALALAVEIHSFLRVITRKQQKLCTLLNEFLLAAESCCPSFVSEASLTQFRGELGFVLLNNAEDEILYQKTELSAQNILSDLEVNRLYQICEPLFTQLLCNFSKVILEYTSSERTNDSLQEFALDHLTQCGLYSDAVRLAIVNTGGVSNLFKLVKTHFIPDDILRLSLRCMAVLCSVAKGCIQLLAIGGLDVIVKLLCTSPRCCAVEAAGVLTQLTSPSHKFAATPPNLSKTVSRLLDLCEDSRDPGGFLLCSAALGNLCVQYSLVCDLLYRHNAVLRISRLFHTKTCRSIFIQDQIATVFAQLCAHNYSDALNAQGGIPCLLSLLQCFDPQQRELSRRIQYKSAICLGKICNNGFGLKCLRENNALPILQRMMPLSNDLAEHDSPVATICKNLVKRLGEAFESRV